MGLRQEAQPALLCEFSREDHVPQNHLLRSIDRFVDLPGSAALSKISTAIRGGPASSNAARMMQSISAPIGTATWERDEERGQLSSSFGLDDDNHKEYASDGDTLNTDLDQKNGLT